MTANITYTAGEHSFCGVNQLVVDISIGIELRADRDGHQEATDADVREAIEALEASR